MSQSAASFAFGGGLDLVSASLVIKPGRAVAALNYEPLSTGYGRVWGYERYDGQAAPSAARLYRMPFTDGLTTIMAGQEIEGASSGATATVVVDVADDEGFIYLTEMTGAFEEDEDIKVAGTAVATVDGEVLEDTSDSSSEYRAALASAQDVYRALIAAPPGSGPLRGIGELDGSIYVFRDNGSATGCVMFKATDAGWVAQSFGTILYFADGAGAEIGEGDTIEGDTSGATAIVRRVVKQTGSWGSDAAGYLVLSDQSGAFVAEDITVSAAAVGTISGNAQAITLPAGGRYLTRSYNFYGARNMRRMYGVNGVGPAFEWDGTVLAPIFTGMAVDIPNRIAVFANHLFLTYPGGSVQHSAPGEPLLWDVILGAEEICVGDDVTDILDATETALAIFALGKVAILTGTDADTFSLADLSDDAGALPWTAQSVGTAIYLDHRGLRSLESTQAYGNFRTGVLTEPVQPLLDAKQRAATFPIASVVCKAKSQYRMFWPDGSGLSVYMGGKYPEALPFALGFAPTCAFRCEMPDTTEAIFVGSDEGMLYRIDSGTSFDGDGIEAYLMTPPNLIGAPGQFKRFHSVDIGATSAGYSEFQIVAEFGGSLDHPPTPAFDLSAAAPGGFWDIDYWGDFLWAATSDDSAFAHIDGIGTSVQFVILSESAPANPPHVLQTYTVNFTPRRQKR